MSFPVAVPVASSRYVGEARRSRHFRQLQQMTVCPCQTFSGVMSTVGGAS